MRGGVCYYGGSQGVCDVQKPVVLVGAASSCGCGSAKGRELEQVKVKVIDMPQGNWLDWLIGSPRGPLNA